jgi:hypothetical protein
MWVVCIGSNSFQGISYAGKPQVVSSYILSNLCVWQCQALGYNSTEFITTVKSFKVQAPVALW